MFKVSIVEDSADDLEVLMSHLRRYEAEKGVRFETSAYVGAEEFINSYNPSCQLVFMDIELPGANGMTAARALRILDPRVPIVFTTNLASYAVEGYEVEALSYLLKPVSYPAFLLVMEKALKRAATLQDQLYQVKTADGFMQLPVSSIHYVEVVRHTLFFHTTRGTLKTRGSMAEVEEALSPLGFSRCHSGYLVNLSHVASVKGADVEVGGDTLPVSRQRRAEFMRELTLALGA